MNIEAPQIIVIALSGMGLGEALVNHGKPKEGRTSFWLQVLSNIITYSLLYWGGFFG